MGEFFERSESVNIRNGEVSQSETRHFIHEFEK